MFGREPRQPIDVIHGSLKEIKFDFDQYVTRLTLFLWNAYDIVRKRLSKEAMKMKTKWDEQATHHYEFNTTEQVLL